MAHLTFCILAMVQHWDTEVMLCVKLLAARMEYLEGKALDSQYPTQAWIMWVPRQLPQRLLLRVTLKAGRGRGRQYG